MAFIGEILKKRRESKNISLFDVSKELNISEENLLNFENNYFEKHIDIVFIIGHLRSYCSFLNLNQNEIIELFKEQHFSKQKKNFEIAKPKFEYKLVFLNKLISFSLMVLIFGFFYYLFIEVENPSREYAIIPDLPENYVSIVEQANLENLVKNQNTKKKLEENFAEIESIPNSSSAIASLSNIANEKSPIITLKLLDDTWLQIRDQNDEIIFSQLMNKYDQYSYDMFDNYSITSGNAGNILLLINEKVIGKVGKKGQVVDSFVVSSDFNN